MKNKSTLCVAFGLALSCSLSAQAASKTTTLTIPLKNGTGESMGEVKLTQLQQGVQLQVTAKGLTPGEHAIHFHGVGKCQGPDFKSAGDHYSPEKREHGFDSAKGHHAGDMPNLIANENGTVSAEIINTQVTLGKGKNSLQKSGGTAIIIHAKADDYKSQPSGEAGGRVACGEIAAAVE